MSKAALFTWELVLIVLGIVVFIIILIMGYGVITQLVEKLKLRDDLKQPTTRIKK